MLSVKINGLAELQAALDQLPVQIERNIVRGALRASGKVMQAAAKSRAPQAAPSQVNAKQYGGRFGLLADSIKINGARLKKGRLVAGVSAGGAVKGGGDAYYAGWVEFGTKPHIIKARRGGRLALGGRKSVRHPGARKKPFMRPALNAAAQAAVLAFGNYVKGRLTKQGINSPDLTIDNS